MVDNAPPDMKLRITAELRQKIEQTAKANNRTLNGEIIARLQSSFQSVEGASQAVLVGRLVDGKHDPIAMLSTLDTLVGSLMKDVATLKAEVAALKAKR